MTSRVLSREERDKAIKEADAILRLGKKWQRQVPNEATQLRSRCSQHSQESHVQQGRLRPARHL